MLEWPTVPTTRSLPKRRFELLDLPSPESPNARPYIAALSGELTMGLESPGPLSRRWTLGARNSGQFSPAKSLARAALDPIASSPQNRFQKAEELCDALPVEATLGGRRSSRQWILPPLDAKVESEVANDFYPSRRLKGCRGASEYLARQSSRRSATEVYELNFVKEAFLRFRSDSAELNVSDLRDVLDHLGYLGITDEAAASLAKEVSRFSTLDFQEMQRVIECAGNFEHQQIEQAFQRQAVAQEDGAHVHVNRLQFILHELGATSDGQAVRESLAASNLPEPSATDGQQECPAAASAWLDFDQVNYFLATHRAAQCCSEALVQSAETIFKSLAHRQSGRLEVSAYRIPELLSRLFEDDVLQSVKELCQRLESNEAAQGCESDASGDEGVDVHRPCRSMGLSEFLTWLRRLRCLHLRRAWQQYEEVACSPGHVSVDVLDSVLPDWPAELERRDEIMKEAGLQGMEVLSFDVVDSLRRRCCLMKDFSVSEAMYFTGVFGHFQPEDRVGFVDRADCLCLFRYMGYGLKGDEIYSLLLDAKAAGHRLLSLSDFLSMMRACRVRETGMLKTAYEMKAQDMGLSDLSDFEETGSGLSVSDVEDGPSELVLNRRQSNESSRAAFRRRSSVKQDAQSKSQVKGEGLVVPSGVLEALGAVGWSLAEEALYEALARLGLTRNLLSLVEFQSLAMLLREEEATQKQTRAGWSTSEARDIQSLYNAHAGEEGRLDEDGLQRLLWDLDIRKGFGELKQLLEKARMLSSDEFGGSKVTLSTLMHLLRFISQKGLRSAFGRESEAFFAESCTEADLAGYRDLFRKLRSSEKPADAETSGSSSKFRGKSESGLTVPLLTQPASHNGKRRIRKCNTGLQEEYPVVVQKIRSALAVPSSVQQVSGAVVMKFLRRLGHRCGGGDQLSPQQQAELWKKVEELSVSKEALDMLSFAAFVRLLGWVRRSDFASIRHHSDKVGSFFRLAESVEI
ncbi:hypothetical protein AK812_SmicGene20021 [Symbiodinium microadriaticum]|uniref:Uncharacterized protein n=1 Tax=Symbiodinium microadriaticum TaxID=2951 RepID=A0A1Q9DR45_SYMMI|nr:hypothetical protein AK812_SmicGene20021 [Symbiodinium microadriaticum]CAE7232583.1 unnamed protein product [Symbiodinium sp. KB8]CAE7558726.1 unnamed protein product [Symbiodinium microadriaticum]